MKEYPDAREYMQRHIDAASHQYAQRLIYEALDPDPADIERIAERTVHEAEESYERACLDVYEHNLQVLTLERQRRRRQLRKKDATMLLILFLFVMCVFGVMASVSFINHSLLMGGIFAAGVAAFALMILGVGIDLLRKEK